MMSDEIGFFEFLMVPKFFLWFLMLPLCFLRVLFMSYRHSFTCSNILIVSFSVYHVFSKIISLLLGLLKLQVSTSRIYNYQHPIQSPPSRYHFSLKVDVRDKIIFVEMSFTIIAVSLNSNKSCWAPSSKFQ